MKEEERRLVLVCPFTSIASVVSDKIGTFASYLLSDRFHNLSRISKIHSPLLLLHGAEDSIIPCDHSRQLYRRAKKHDIVAHIKILEKCDHNTMDLRRIASHLKHFFHWQFDNARKKDRKARYGSFVSQLKNAYPSSGDGDGDDAAVALKGPAPMAVGSPDGKKKKERKKKADELGDARRKKRDSGRARRKKNVADMTTAELFPEAPNLEMLDLLSVKVPAYCWLKPRPVSQDEEEKREKDRELQAELEKGAAHRDDGDLGAGNAGDSIKSKAKKRRKSRAGGSGSGSRVREKDVDEAVSYGSGDGFEIVRAHGVDRGKMASGSASGSGKKKKQRKRKSGSSSRKAKKDEFFMSSRKQQQTMEQFFMNASMHAPATTGSSDDEDGSDARSGDERANGVDDRDDSPALNFGSAYLHDSVRATPVLSDNAPLILDASSVTDDDESGRPLRTP